MPSSKGIPIVNFYSLGVCEKKDQKMFAHKDKKIFGVQLVAFFDENHSLNYYFYIPNSID
jgi:hypothetical protein